MPRAINLGDTLQAMGMAQRRREQDDAERKAKKARQRAQKGAQLRTLGTTAGMAIGAAYGGPAGMAAGGQVGSALGGAVSASQGNEDYNSREVMGAGMAAAGYAENKRVRDDKVAAHKAALGAKYEIAESYLNKQRREVGDVEGEYVDYTTKKHNQQIDKKLAGLKKKWEAGKIGEKDYGKLVVNAIGKKNLTDYRTNDDGTVIKTVVDPLTGDSKSETYNRKGLHTVVHKVGDKDEIKSFAKWEELEGYLAENPEAIYLKNGAAPYLASKLKTKTQVDKARLDRESREKIATAQLTAKKNKVTPGLMKEVETTARAQVPTSTDMAGNKTFDQGIYNSKVITGLKDRITYTNRPADKQALRRILKTKEKERNDTFVRRIKSLPPEKLSGLKSALLDGAVENVDEKVLLAAIRIQEKKKRSIPPPPPKNEVVEYPKNTTVSNLWKNPAPSNTATLRQFSQK